MKMRPCDLFTDKHINENILTRSQFLKAKDLDLGTRSPEAQMYPLCLSFWKSEKNKNNPPPRIIRASFCSTQEGKGFSKSQATAAAEAPQPRPTVDLRVTWQVLAAAGCLHPAKASYELRAATSLEREQEVGSEGTKMGT